MKKGYYRIIAAVLAVALATAMFPSPAFAAEGDTDPQSKRTIMLYHCGSNLETDAGLATYNLRQILASHFSSDDDITFLVMIGGSHIWQIRR